MKIRIKGNTVRYRLTKTEVATLAEKGTLEEKTEFASSTLAYAIKKAGTDSLSADLLDNKLTLNVPEPMLQRWAFAAEETGIDHNMVLPNGGLLYLLLEKDFKCIDADMTDDQSDFFENPHLTC